MTNTFYFYDLETSGISAKNHRIMQFAGQRTTVDFKPVGEPDDMLIKLTPDVLPEPEAIMVTGITPQKTLTEGVSEHQFLEYFDEKIAIPGTIFVGFNSIRFDDEFMRYTHYRNLRDPYEWSYKNNCSRWDLLDVVRMTRALRPDGINWPIDSDGNKVNRLELITKLNNLDHSQAHNALSDVTASIELAKLLRLSQPKLFDYLLQMREKKSVINLLTVGNPVVYTSGSYESEYEKTTIAQPLQPTLDSYSMLMFDLRIDAKKWLADQAYRSTVSAIKALKYNKCPAIAPLAVVDEASWTRIGLNQKDVINNSSYVQKNMQAIVESYQAELPTDASRDSVSLVDIPLSDVDGAMYEGFFPDSDRQLMNRLYSMPADELVDARPKFVDKRLEGLFFLFRARQHPKTLLSEDRLRWEEYLLAKFSKPEDNVLEKYMAKLQEIAERDYLDADKRFILEELALYAQSVVPSDGY